MRYRNAKILAAAKGERCRLASEFCNHNPETTVMAHFDRIWAGKGMGRKADDIAVVAMCSGCHDAYGAGLVDMDEHFIRAYYSTMMMLINKGVLQ